jgi:plastocyanin
MMESKSVSKCEDGIVARVVYSRLFPDWAKPQTGRLNKSPHTVRAFASRRKKEKQYKERKRPLTLREARFEWFRSLAFPVVFFLFSLPPVTGRPVKTHAEIKVTAKVEMLNSRVKARNGKIDAGGVVVWLESLEGDSPRGPRTPQKILQIGKRFKPHVMAVERGTEVYFPNLDPFFHNVFSLYEGKRFDLGLYASGETRPVVFNRVGISYIFCNIHPRMSAIVVTVATPYFAISDEEGAVTISNIPEGHYQLKVWHERTSDEELAAQSRVVRVAAGAAAAGPAAAGAAGCYDLGLIRLNEAGYMLQPHKNKHGGQYDSEHSKPSYKRQ